MNKVVKKITYSIAIGMMLMVTNVSAQEARNFTIQDFELWTGAEVGYKFNKLWSINLEQQVRFKEDASLLDQRFTQLSLKKKMGSNFAASFGTRFIRYNDTNGNVQGIENRFRWNLDLEYKQDIERLTLSSRLRYQSRSEKNEDYSVKNTFRLKLGSKYNIKKWKLDPKFSMELYNGLTDAEGFNKLRMTFGTSYKIKKFGEISAFYRWEKELVGNYPLTVNVVGLNYKYTIKNKKK